MWYEKHLKLRNLTDIVLCDKTSKRDRAPRWRWIVDVFFKGPQRFKRCQVTIQSAFEYADTAFLFIQHCCIFVFCFAFRPNVLSFFAKIVAGLTRKCTVKGEIWSRKAGFNWTKKPWGRTSLMKFDVTSDKVHHQSTSKTLTLARLELERDVSILSAKMVYVDVWPLRPTEKERWR